MPCYTALQTVSYSDSSQCRTLLRGYSHGERSTPRHPQVSALATDTAMGDIQAGNSSVYKCVNGRAPESLAEFCHPSVDRRPGMRSAVSGKLHVPRTLQTPLMTDRSPSLVPETSKITNYRKKSTEITEPKSQTLCDKITK